MKYKHTVNWIDKGNYFICKLEAHATYVLQSVLQLFYIKML